MNIKRSIYFNKSGIYCFTNKLNNKKYIGQTICFYTRFTKHKKGISGAPKFENAIKKYGFKGFFFEILEYCEENLLNEREEYWILFHQTLNDKFGYNILQRQDRIKRKKHTEESKAKMSSSQRKAFPNGRSGENNPFYGQKHSQESLDIITKKAIGKISPNRKPIIAYNDKEIKEFQYLDLAAKAFNGSRTSIWKAIKNQKIYKGFLWRYK